MSDGPSQELDTIDQLETDGEKTKRDSAVYRRDAIYGEFRPREGYVGAKPKRDGVPLVQDFSGKALGTLIAYFAFWVLGFVLNIVFLIQARNLQKQGEEVKGIGRLWALLSLFIILQMIALLIIVF